MTSRAKVVGEARCTLWQPLYRMGHVMAPRVSRAGKGNINDEDGLEKSRQCGFALMEHPFWHRSCVTFRQERSSVAPGTNKVRAFSEFRDHILAPRVNDNVKIV